MAKEETRAERAEREAGARRAAAIGALLESKVKSTGRVSRKPNDAAALLKAFTAEPAPIDSVSVGELVSATSAAAGTVFGMVFDIDVVQKRLVLLDGDGNPTLTLSTTELTMQSVKKKRTVEVDYPGQPSTAVVLHRVQEVNDDETPISAAAAAPPPKPGQLGFRMGPH